MRTTLRMTTTKRKTTKRTSDLFSGGLRNPLESFRVKVEPAHCFAIFRHPFLPIGHLICMWRMIPVLALVSALGAISAPALRAGAQTSSSSNSHAHDFVIFATVFTSQGFTLPGARMRVRRADEKKFRWEAMSDRRGELGIRVKQGAEYELTIEARGFKSQMRKVDARDGNREEMTLQMERLAGGKS